MFPELRSLGSRERQELRKAVEAANGKVYVMVHPLWTVSKPAYENLESIAVARSSAPLVILETPGGVGNTTEALSKIKSESGLRKVFFVKTLPAWATPLEGWKNVIDSLEEIGVRHVVVAGQVLNYCHPEPGSSEAQIVPLQRERIEKVVRRLRGRTKTMGVTPDENALEKVRRSAELVPTECVGETHKRLLLSKRFKSVRILPRRSLWGGPDLEHRLNQALQK